MKRNILVSLLIIATCFAQNGCKKALDTAPTNAIGQDVVYNNLGLLSALLQGTYSKMKNDVPVHLVNGAVLIKVFSTSYGSDINTDLNPPYGNETDFKSASFYQPESYIPTGYLSRGLWQEFYSSIYNTNVILENIDKVSGDQATKDAIKGQALIIRARCYFNLVRIYQQTYSIAKDKLGIPLILSSTIQPNVPRTTVDSVYSSILSDLTSAEQLLQNFVRPSIAFYDNDVADFILSNVYLTMNDWANAQKFANKIRTKYPLMTISEYQSGFTTINEEWVLGYTQTIQDNTTDNLAAFYDYGQNNTQDILRLFYPSSQFVNLMKGDPRGMFIPHPTEPGNYATTKFIEHNTSAPFGDILDMRAAEMYLVEAEAAVRQGNSGLALTVLNMVQNARPGAAVTTTTDPAQLLAAILLERRKEMYGEGLDYFDIKRLQLPVIKSLAAGNLLDLSLKPNSNILTLMIPDQEVLNNNAIVQNPDPSVIPYFVP